MHNSKPKRLDMTKRVHSDVKVLPESVRGFRCAITHVHGPTRHVYVDKSRTKSEVTESVKAIISKVQKLHNVNVVEFRSDGGGEHTSNELKEWLKMSGIEWTPNAAYASEQNGVAERAIRTIVQKVRTMLKQCGRPMGHWCYAIDVAVHLCNITHNSSIDNTPHIKRHDKMPDLSSLVVFGCMGVANVPEKQRKAMSSSA